MRRVTWVGGPYDGATIPIPRDVPLVTVEDRDGVHVCPVLVDRWNDGVGEVLWTAGVPRGTA